MTRPPRSAPHRDASDGRPAHEHQAVSLPYSRPDATGAGTRLGDASPRMTADHLSLDAGTTLGPVTIAYQTYGTLNAERSNAVLVCHALTGDQFAASAHPLTGKPGWWDHMVGPGKPVDTDRFFVIVPNTLGGCMGTTGPSSLNPATGRIYGLDFPVITIADIARAQALLIDHLGIDQLAAVIGGSMGGMLALEWASAMPDRLRMAMPIAAAARHTAQNIAFYEVGRQAIMADPHWHEGAYTDYGVVPEKGLAVARMAAHITYLSGTAMDRKFGRSLQDRARVSFTFDADFQVESYLRHQGRSFVSRFDANSYLYITRAMDYFDLGAAHGGRLALAFAHTTAKIRLLSFTSDWHYPTAESRLILDAALEAGIDAAHEEIASDKGHDAFLLDEPEMARLISTWLDDAL